VAVSRYPIRFERTSWGAKLVADGKLLGAPLGWRAAEGGGPRCPAQSSAISCAASLGLAVRHLLARCGAWAARFTTKMEGVVAC